MAENNSVVLVDVMTGERLGSLSGSRGDLDFPAPVRGWVDVLDCRHGRYQDMDLDAIRHTAEHARKPYVVLNASRL